MKNNSIILSLKIEDTVVPCVVTGCRDVEKAKSMVESEESLKVGLVEADKTSGRWDANYRGISIILSNEIYSFEVYAIGDNTSLSCVIEDTDRNLKIGSETEAKLSNYKPEI